MPLTDAERRAHNKWMRNQIVYKLRMSQETKDRIDSYVKKHAVSINSFINTAIIEKLDRDD